MKTLAGFRAKTLTEWQLGLDYLMGPWVFTGSYAQSDVDSYTYKTTAIADETRMGYGLAAAYTLSKRTFVYGGWEQDTSEQNGRSDLDHSIFAIGVNHKF